MIILGIGRMEKIKVQVQYKDNKYPFFEDKMLNVTEIGDRVRSRIIYVSGRFVKNDNNGSYIEFEQISPIVVKLQNAKMIVTEKGTLVIKYEEGSTLYVVEIPSGYRGSANVKILNDNCIETNVLMSPAGSLGIVNHIWCNGNAEIQYKISGRTRTAGFESLRDLFGENLSGKIKIENDKVEVIFDEELDKLLS